LYDEEIDILYSIPQFDTDGELEYKGIIKINSKRGFVGKVFSEGEIQTADGKREVEMKLEAEENNINKLF
jgi:hypothetical protein